MGLCGTPSIPNAGEAAAAGIKADLENQPFSYLINAAATLGNRINIGGREYDFTGLGQADTAGKVSDAMAQTLLDLQREKSPELIQQHLNQLKAADPKGYQARQDLFDRIMADAKSNPNSPVSADLQKELQNELAKGVGFNDAKQEEEVREGVRGQQAYQGITLGTSPTSQEAKTIVKAGEGLQTQRQQNALKLLQSGATPEDVAYKHFQQTLGNLGSFVNNQTPEAQFRQVGGAANGPVSLYGGAPSSQFDPNAANSGMDYSMGIYRGQNAYNAAQANPWLSGFGTAASAVGTLSNINGWGGGGGGSPWWMNGGPSVSAGG